MMGPSYVPVPDANTNKKWQRWEIMDRQRVLFASTSKVKGRSKDLKEPEKELDRIIKSNSRSANLFVQCEVVGFMVS